jgi:hypothetical protein
MSQTQISDVVVPEEFSAYIVENSMVSTAIFQSGVAVPNGLISGQLQAGSTQFTVPVWSDDGESETDVMIFEEYEAVASTQNHIKQLHGVLLKYSSKDQDHPGQYGNLLRSLSFPNRRFR